MTLRIAERIVQTLGEIRSLRVEQLIRTKLQSNILKKEFSTRAIIILKLYSVYCTADVHYEFIYFWLQQELKGMLISAWLKFE